MNRFDVAVLVGLLGVPLALVAMGHEQAGGAVFLVVLVWSLFIRQPD